LGYQGGRHESGERGFVQRTRKILLVTRAGMWGPGKNLVKLPKVGGGTKGAKRQRGWVCWGFVAVSGVGFFGGFLFWGDDERL